jgi:hypothetical protein
MHKQHRRMWHVTHPMLNDFWRKKLAAKQPAVLTHMRREAKNILIVLFMDMPKQQNSPTLGMLYLPYCAEPPSQRIPVTKTLHLLSLTVRPFRACHWHSYGFVHLRLETLFCAHQACFYDTFMGHYTWYLVTCDGLSRS